MRFVQAITATLLFALAACGQAAAPTEADAQTAGATQSGDVTAAERSAILAALQMPETGDGKVANECGEAVTPQFIVADIGSGPGRVIAFNIGGGPNMVSCYGDGSLTIFFRQNASGAWEQIWENRPGGAIILPTQHNNGNDIADGGPGMSFPVWQWNGTTYVNANRTVSDSQLGDARFIPN